MIVLHVIDLSFFQRKWEVRGFLSHAVWSNQCIHIVQWWTGRLGTFSRSCSINPKIDIWNSWMVELATTNEPIRFKFVITFGLFVYGQREKRVPQICCYSHKAGFVKWMLLAFASAKDLFLHCIAFMETICRFQVIRNYIRDLFLCPWAKQRSWCFFILIASLLVQYILPHKSSDVSIDIQGGPCGPYRHRVGMQTSFSITHRIHNRWFLQIIKAV